MKGWWEGTGWGQTVRGFAGHTRSGRQGTMREASKERNNIIWFVF